MSPIGNYFQPTISRDQAAVAIVRVTAAITVPSWDVANLAGIALSDVLGRQFAVITAGTFATFNAIQQPVATPLGIHAGHQYAVVGFNAATQTVTLRNPHNRPGTGGAEIPIPLADFRLLFTNLASDQVAVARL